MVPDGCCEAVTVKPKRDPLEEIKKIEARRKVADAKTNYAIGELKDQIAVIAERLEYLESAVFPQWENKVVPAGNPGEAKDASATFKMCLRMNGYTGP